MCDLPACLSACLSWVPEMSCLHGTSTVAERKPSSDRFSLPSLKWLSEQNAKGVKRKKLRSFSSSAGGEVRCLLTYGPWTYSFPRESLLVLGRRTGAWGPFIWHHTEGLTCQCIRSWGSSMHEGLLLKIPESSPLSFIAIFSECLFDLSWIMSCMAEISIYCFH